MKIKNLKKFKVVKNPKLPKIFKKKGVKLGFFMFLIISTITLLLGGLYYIQPEIKVGFIDSDNISVETTLINQDSQYPVFDVSSSHYLSFPAKKVYVEENYQTTAQDFDEGNNEIELSGVLDLVFLKLVSNKPSRHEIFVDKVAPVFEITQEPAGAVLLESNAIKVKGEPNLLLTITENGEQREIELGAEGNEQSIELITNDGDNSILYYFTDSNGNKSEERSFDYYSFNRPGYTKHNCPLYSFPLESGLQIGQYTDSKKTKLDYASCDGEILVTFKGAYNPCTGPCDYMPFYINIDYFEGSPDSLLSEMKKYTDFVKQVPITNSFGMEGTYYETRVAADVLGTFQTKIVVFQKDNKTYTISSLWQGQNDKEQLDDRFELIYKNFQLYEGY